MGTQCSAIYKRSVGSSIAPRIGIKKHSHSKWRWNHVLYKIELERITSPLDLFQMLDHISMGLYQVQVPKGCLYTIQKNQLQFSKRFLPSLRDVYLHSSFFLYLLLYQLLEMCSHTERLKQHGTRITETFNSQLRLHSSVDLGCFRVAED